MPIENERKFVLETENELENLLSRTPGVTRSIIRQAYLDVTGLRVRSIVAGSGTQFIFTYKRTVRGRVVEIETEILEDDFERLWSVGHQMLRKVRYSWDDGPYHWDIDFFKADGERTYFALAEVEMPEAQTVPPALPANLAVRSLGLVPQGDPRFASKRLADQTHAERLLSDIRLRGAVE
ncbi:CYTH domain-containing protein [Enhydrobacter aerosaccus]|uniref:CYTH domain-containing protein n=1 Tax=Enhydrobacter aerosaccus TaxID=225324 RepID=A0A1T4L3A7_9HYPH|nr:hypothetical protein [Enhydrobacter aerosaccus]SJZ49027.1 CYTH domain-containing protein [Enhydrobacter aerosaccus]